MYIYIFHKNKICTNSYDGTYDDMNRINRALVNAYMQASRLSAAKKI